MPRITAFIHTRNDAPRIGRTIETLRPCDEILVIDHDSTDDTVKIARRHGATVKKAIVGVEDGAYAFDAQNDWILCLSPGETLSEGLEATLYEWKHRPEDDASGYCLAIREQKDAEWSRCAPELRLVNRSRLNWTDALPQNSEADALEGDLLRYDQ